MYVCVRVCVCAVFSMPAMLQVCHTPHEMFLFVHLVIVALEGGLLYVAHQSIVRPFPLAILESEQAPEGKNAQNNYKDNIQNK